MEPEREITARLSERQMRLWNALHPATSPGPISRFITISREEGTLGDEIAQELAKNLGWHLYDKELVRQIADTGHLPKELVQKLDEKTASFRKSILDTVLHLVKMPESTELASENYHKSLLKTLATIAAYGNSIFVGRGANFVLYWAPQGLHFRFTASMDFRIQRLCSALHTTPEIAENHIRKTDRERREFISYHFGKDLDDPRFYDAVFSTDRLTVQQIVGTILALMKTRFARPTADMTAGAFAH